MSETYDLLVIGGGINGAGIARDAAGRGAKVLLVEKDDLAGHTSSASTKLVHGGLRYLEHYEFRLVRESLIERERLLAMAPHIIWPLRFVLPHDTGLRPKWMLRLGLFLYDHIGGRKILPPTRTVNLRDRPHGRVLQDRLVKGFEYSDCWVEDSRLVVLNAMDAKLRGADIRTRTECVSLERGAETWSANLQAADGTQTAVSAKIVVNSAGPWVDKVLGLAQPGRNHANLRLVKGSHLIFPRLFDHDDCYIFQNKDDRIVFAIPYERDFTLVGTTDVAFTGDPNGIKISAEESQYICDAVNEYLRKPIAPESAVASYAGVRPLYDDQAADNSTVTRDYVFELDDDGGKPPILSIFGGKITTYRKLAEHALEKLGISGEKWTANSTLPGGDLGENCLNAAEYAAEFAWAFDTLGRRTVVRMAHAYGSRLDGILGSFNAPNDLGKEIAPGVWEAELRYLVEHEFAQSAEDVLWRRSKLGLHINAADQEQITQWFSSRQKAWQ